MLQSRHDNFIKYLAEAKQGESSFEKSIVPLIEDKAATNDSLLILYKGEATEERSEAFFEASRRAWEESVPDAFDQIESSLVGPFALGDQVVSMSSIPLISSRLQICTSSPG
jgi:hypothetical protein